MQASPAIASSGNPGPRSFAWFGAGPLHIEDLARDSRRIIAAAEFDLPTDPEEEDFDDDEDEDDDSDHLQFSLESEWR
jgi:hypothetical protein